MRDHVMYQTVSQNLEERKITPESLDFSLLFDQPLGKFLNHIT